MKGMNGRERGCRVPTKLIELMAKLRGPNGCSWDREQTMASLRAFVLEEAYELVDAIGQNNTEAVC